VVSPKGTMSKHGNMVSAGNVDKEEEADEVPVVVETNTIIHPWTVMIWVDKVKLRVLFEILTICVLTHAKDTSAGRMTNVRRRGRDTIDGLVPSANLTVMCAWWLIPSTRAAKPWTAS
jgi:hypothetical protein